MPSTIKQKIVIITKQLTDLSNKKQTHKRNNPEKKYKKSEKINRERGSDGCWKGQNE